MITKRTKKRKPKADPLLTYTESVFRKSAEDEDREWMKLMRKRTRMSHMDDVTVGGVTDDLKAMVRRFMTEPARREKPIIGRLVPSGLRNEARK